MRPTLLALSLLAPTLAFAEDMTVAQATAVYARILATPAELKLHCEQVKLQGDTVEASMKGDRASVSKMGMRIEEIQKQLPGYKDALRVVSSRAGDMAFYKTDEGKALDKADKDLAFACKPPRK